MTKRHVSTFIALLLLCMLTLPSASAQLGLTSELTVIEDTILKDEAAEYLLKITNPYGTEQKVRLTFEGDIEWILRTDPLYHGLTGITIPAYSTSETIVRISLRQQTIPARQYRFGLLITSEESGQSARQEFEVNLRSGVSGTYRPAISLNADFPVEIDPRDTVQLRLTLKNRNILEIDELLIVSSGDLTEKETLTTLDALEEKIVIQDMTFDPVLPPAEDMLRVTLYYNDESVGSAEIYYTAKAYSDIIVTEGERGGFLQTIFDLSYFNDGNIAAAETVKRKTSLWRVPFTKTEPKAELTHDSDGWFLTWDINLVPQGKADFLVNQDFRFFTATLIIVGVILALYFTLRTPVVLRKEAVVVKKGQGIEEVKIVLHVKNRSTQRIDELLVTDSVPDIIEVNKKFSIGTIKPEKILKHAKRGTVLRWKLDFLEPLEERIITYRVKAKLSIIGQVTLPMYVAKFKVQNKERITTSNSVSLSSIQPRR